jgi:hypothetical protein
MRPPGPKWVPKKAGVNNPNFGHTRSEETKRKIAQALTKYWASIPSNKATNNLE